MKVLVTGGGGFLGQGIVRALVDQGHQVRSYSRGEYPKLLSLGVECIAGDVQDLSSMIRAANGCDAVFHVAAKAGVWGAYHDFYQTNVIGTRNVIEACRINGVKFLIYTSSPSVVFDGRDQEGIDEATPFPVRFLAHYPATKAMAEADVLAANSPQLATLALRPHLIWGPGDNHLIPRLLASARQNKLRLVGTKDKLVDSVYIDNAVDAHLLALKKLAEGGEIAGRSFFVTNHQPILMAELINGILRAAQLPAISKRMPAWLAVLLGSLCEFVFAALRLRGEPPMTRFVAKQLATAHWYDQTNSRLILGYRPNITIAEGLRRLQESLA